MLEEIRELIRKDIKEVKGRIDELHGMPVALKKRLMKRYGGEIRGHKEKLSHPERHTEKLVIHRMVQKFGSCGSVRYKNRRYIGPFSVEHPASIEYFRRWWVSNELFRPVVEWFLEAGCLNEGQAKALLRRLDSCKNAETLGPRPTRY